MMPQRFMSIWFPSLLTDWKCIKQPALKDKPLVFADKLGNRVVISAASSQAIQEGVHEGMPLADARAILPELEVIENQGQRAIKILKALAIWCIRYSPLVGMENPNGLILDITGCAHLWGGEREYLKEIVNRLRQSGYYVRAAISDTIGTSWAVSRFGTKTPIIKSGEEAQALLALPPMALRLAEEASQKLIKLGLKTIENFIGMPRSVLRRRIGEDSMQRIEQALGKREEHFSPVILPAQYHERLSCLEPVRTRKAIEIAIEKLLEGLCKKLKMDGMGLRKSIMHCYRVDGKILKTEIGTNTPNANPAHLFKLFSLKIDQIEPRLGIELFFIDAVQVEKLDLPQDVLWKNQQGMDDSEVMGLLDRLAGKVGSQAIQRFVPQSCHWPERSIKKVETLNELPTLAWRTDRERPVQLLKIPEIIQVSAPIPDYPPMVFRYQGITHQIKKADGPERIEREWWLDEGEHRDYYQVEDQQGKRYWLFRSGHYDSEKVSGWFIHGFFA